MQPYIDYQEYYKIQYRNQLKKDANRVGTYLILLFATMFAVSFITTLVPTITVLFTDFDSDLSFLEDTTFLMIISGLASLCTFFLVPIIYCIATKSSITDMFPLDKAPRKLTYLLCTFGLSVAIISNYASNLLLTLFEAIGVNAYVDIDYPCDSALDVILFYVTVAVVPALVEEFAFRGFLLNYLRKHSDSLAILVSGVMFGVLHGNFTQIPFAIIVGLVLGYIAVKTNSLLPGIIIHFLNNALSVTFSLLESNTELTDTIISLLDIIMMLAIAILGITSFVILTKNYKGFFKLNNSDSIIPFKEKVKVVLSSPTIIIFTVISFIEAIAMLSLEV